MTGAGTGGASVSYTASATDIVDGTIPVSCSPASGSTFAFGTTTVTCSPATDSHGNASSGGSFPVTVNHTNAPSVTVPTGITVEANGPDGSVVTFLDPAKATDDKDAGIHGAPCTPHSGLVFKIGTTIVTCSVKDSDGNTGSASFVVTVEDTTDPVITPPVDLWIQTTDASIGSSNTQIVGFLAGATAQDIVDAQVAITNDSPTSFKKGVTTVTFTAKDDAGNSSEATATVTISPDPAPPGSQDRTPPKNVSNVEARTGDRSAIFNWKNPADEDFDHVMLSREPGAGGATSSVVYAGAKASFKDTGLTIGTQYRYLLVAYDEAGNRSVGVAVVVVGRQQLLFTPADGATVRKPPTLTWAKVSGATYYNVQLWKQPSRSGSSSTATPGTKVYSAWPATNKLKLKKSWKFGGKRHKLLPGIYRWYVFPGMGPRAKNTYGDLIGQSEFVVKAKKRR